MRTWATITTKIKNLATIFSDKTLDNITHYKLTFRFYLAFENHDCPDYITEKYLKTNTDTNTNTIYGICETQQPGLYNRKVL